MKRQSSARSNLNELRIRKLKTAKRLSALILIILLAGSWGISLSALPFPGSDGLPQPPDSQRSYEAWLKATGKPVTSRYRGYVANFETWRDYRLLVYGTPRQVLRNRYDAKSGQYASLGFSYDEISVTNSLFPDDSPDGKTHSSPWQWVEHNLGTAAQISWARLSSRQKSWIKRSALTYSGKAYGKMTFSALGLSEQKTIVLTPPSWQMGFSLYTTHDLPGRPGNVRYATFNGCSAGGAILMADIQVANKTDSQGRIILDRDSDWVDIQYTISGWIEKFEGLAGWSDIHSCGAGNDSDWAKGSRPGPWSITLSRRVSRTEIAPGEDKTVTLDGSAWLVTQLGDIQIQSVEESVVVHLEDPIPPFSATVSLKGAIGYFAGQTTLRGQVVPLDPLRFLGLEKLLITVDFNRPPRSIRYSLAGSERVIFAKAGQTHYEASMIVPTGHQTMNWQNGRERDALSFELWARERSKTNETVSVTIPGVDLTGSVYDITIGQVTD